jgi:mRNA interferase MazF
VWWANLGEEAGNRPVLLLSRDEAYRVRAFVTVAPVTTRVRGIPVEVALGEADGMPRRCVVNLDSLVTIARSRLERPVARLAADKMKAVETAIRFALDPGAAP